MGLPEIPEFESLLKSLRPSAPEGEREWREWSVVAEENIFDDYRKTLPAINVWFSEKEGLAVEALLKRISDELRHNGHPDDIDIANVILGFFAYSQRSGSSAVAEFNKVFSKITSADLNQFFVFASPSPLNYRFRIGSFLIGPFNPERLAYQCQKVKSNFYERYRSMFFKSSLSVEREPFRVKVIRALPWQLTGEVHVRLTDTYFSLLSRVYFENFFETLNLDQELGIALGSGWFDALRLKELIQTHRISVFMNIGHENIGFVSPSLNATLNVNLGGAHLGMPVVEKIVKEQFHFVLPEKSELHQIIRLYSHFLSLSVRHHNDGRHAEGFLHGVIALDLLLGEKSNSTKSVVKRSAALVYQSLRSSYAETLKLCEKIYDARSKYVHKGEPPDRQLEDITTKICREIAFCILRLQRNSENRVAGIWDKWVKQIDIVVALLEADQLPSGKDFSKIGVASKGEYRLEDLEQTLKGGDSHRECHEGSDPQ